MVGPAEAGLPIAEYGVDSLEFRQILGLAAAADRRLVDTPGGGYRSEAREAVGGHDATWRQVQTGPSLQGLEGETRDWGQLHPQRVRIVVQRYRRDERGPLSEPRPALPPLRSPPR
jgi:hypothetical protein